MDGCIYRLVVDGELGSRFAEAFESMTCRPGNGRTEISGAVVDQAQLRALLSRIDDLGLTLISAGRLESAGAGPRSEEVASNG